MNPEVVMVTSQERMKCTRPLTDLTHCGAFTQFADGSFSLSVFELLRVSHRSHSS